MQWTDPARAPFGQPGVVQRLPPPQAVQWTDPGRAPFGQPGVVQFGCGFLGAGLLMPQEAVEAAGLQMTRRRASFLRDDERFLPLDQMRPTIGLNPNSCFIAKGSARSRALKSACNWGGEMNTLIAGPSAS